MTRSVGEDVRARLRLVPSDGEIQCPKKGQLAIGRCLELQHELLCTCPTYLAYQGPDPEQLRIPDMSAATQAAEEDDEMSQKNGGTARVLAALRRAPDKVFLPDEIAGLKGGSRNAVHPMMIRLVRSGMAVRSGGGYKAGPRLLGEPEMAPVVVEVVRKPQPRAERQIQPPDRAAKAPTPPEDEDEELVPEVRSDEDRSEVVEAGPDRPAEVPEPSPAPAAAPAPAPLPPADEQPAPPIDTARVVASLRWALDGVAAGFIDLDGFQRHLERVRGGR